MLNDRSGMGERNAVRPLESEVGLASRIDRIASVVEQGRNLIAGFEDWLAQDFAEFGERLVAHQREIQSSRNEAGAGAVGRENARTALQQAKHEVDELRSALEQRREEAAQAWAEAHELRQVLSNLENERDSLRAKLDKANAWVFELASQRKKLEVELDREARTARSLSGRIEDEQRRISALEGKLSDERASHRRTASESIAVQSDLSREAARLSRREAQLAGKVSQLDSDMSDRFSELAILSARLLATERNMQNAQGSLEWLQHVFRACTNFPGWWGVFPASFQKRWRDDRLRRKALFDSDQYLELNRDVAAAGDDPLRHYIVHGMNEGRPRG